MIVFCDLVLYDLSDRSKHLLNQISSGDQSLNTGFVLTFCDLVLYDLCD